MSKTTIFLTLLLLLVGCNKTNPTVPDDFEPQATATVKAREEIAVVTPQVTKTPTVAPTLLASPCPSRASVSTATQVLPTRTPIPPTTVPEIVEERCGTFHTEQDTPGMPSVAGIVVQEKREDFGVEIQNGGQTDQPAFVPSASGWSYTVQVSPNSQWLAYGVLEEDGSTVEFFVIDPATDEMWQIRVGDDLIVDANLFALRWLNETQLLIPSRANLEDYTNQYSALVWSPFSGDQEVISVELSGFSHWQGSFDSTSPVLDPQLKLINYVCYEDSCNGTDIRVQDIETGEIVWSVDDEMDDMYLHLPLIWSRGGEYAAGFGRKQDELLTLMIYSRDGVKIQEVTFPDPGSPSAPTVWSPDDRYFLFGTKRYDEDGELFSSLAFFDLENGSVVHFCSMPSPDNVHWSPEGTAIVYEHVDTTEYDFSDWIYKGYIIDIATGDNFKWYETMTQDFLLGWALPMKSDEPTNGSSD